MDKAKIKKIGKIALDVLLYIFLAICIFAVIVTVQVGLSKPYSARESASEICCVEMMFSTEESIVRARA